MTTIPTEAQLIQAARAARLKAYAPYSQFKVGAAVAARDGKVYQGCNIENASYGLTNCAERTALFSAIADGQQPGDLIAMAVTGDTEQAIAPCGACRQVMLELGGAALAVTLTNLASAVERTTAARLLPGGFSSADMPTVEK